MTDTEIQEILLALQGQLVINPWKNSVPNIFAKGMPCSQLYEEVYDANCRLCKRLGDVDDDPDVELIINALLQIADIQACETFRCGMKFATESRNAEDSVPYSPSK